MQYYFAMFVTESTTVKFTTQEILSAPGRLIHVITALQQPLFIDSWYSEVLEQSVNILSEPGHCFST